MNGFFKTLTSIFGGGGEQQSAITNLSPQEFKDNYKNAPNAVLLDVRRPEELAGGKIKGAKNMNVLSRDFAKNIQSLDKDKAYFVYCRSGKRSMIACKALQEAGISKTYNLQGGYVAWSSAF